MKLELENTIFGSASKNTLKIYKNIRENPNLNIGCLK
jgi:hypothetical protein